MIGIISNRTKIQKLIAVAFLLFGLWFFASDNVQAATVGDVTGFAWSSTIGWVSANCLDTYSCGTSDYSVKLNPITGDLSGQAWSENIGWISFNRSETNNPPQAPYNTGVGAIAKYDLGTGVVTGWARALAGCEDVPGSPASSCASSSAGLASGNWDGWIKLAGVATDGSPYGVTVSNDGDMSGWAWGGEVVGWISFSGTASDGSPYGFKVALPDTSSLDLVADPIIMPAVPGNVDLTWVVANVDNCVASNNGSVVNWTGGKDSSDGPHTETVNVSMVPITFEVTCEDTSGGTISDSVTVTSSAVPPIPPVPSVPTADVTVGLPHCEIPVGASTCVGTLSWSSSDLIGDPSVRQNGSEIYDTISGSGVTDDMSHGPNNFSFIDEGSGLALDNEIVNIGCVSGSSWNGSVCEPNTPTTPSSPPVINVNVDPKLIRSGRTVNINVDITSDANLTCSFINTGGSSMPPLSHTGSAGVVSHGPFVAGPFTSTQIVTVRCTVDADPTYTIPDVEARVNVLPSTQEI